MPPKTLAEQFYKQINFWKKHKTGGHFAALEQPDELVLDINDFVKKIFDYYLQFLTSFSIFLRNFSLTVK